MTGSSSSLRTLISREPIPEDCDEFTLKKKGNSTKEEFAIYNKVWCRREIRWVSQNFGSKRLSNFAVVVEMWILTDNFYTITWLVCALSLVVDRDPLKDTHTDGVKSTSDHVVSILVLLFLCTNPSIIVLQPIWDYFFVYVLFNK